MSADENDTCEDNMHRRWMVAEERADEAEVRVKELEAERDKLTERYKTIRDISALRLGEIDDTRAIVFETVKERDRLAAENAGLRETLELYNTWDELAADRGGKNGPKGKAFQRFVDAKAAALAGDGSAVLAVLTAARNLMIEIEAQFSQTGKWDPSNETVGDLADAFAKLDSEDGKEALDDG